MCHSLSAKISFLNEKGVSAKQLAEAAGCNISTIYRLRDGLILDPSYSIGYSIDKQYAQLAENVAA